jgi:hypothetical protein
VLLNLTLLYSTAFAAGAAQFVRQMTFDMQMYHSQYAENCFTCCKVVARVKNAEMNIVNDSESRAVWANHIHLGLKNFLDSCGLLASSSSSNKVESEVDVEERRGMVSRNFSSSRTGWYLDSIMNCKKKKFTPGNLIIENE